MGACASVQDRAAMERSAEIDRQIEEDSRRFRKECKILLLGEFISTSLGGCSLGRSLEIWIYWNWKAKDDG